MLRILLISYEFPPVAGGAGSVGHDYARFLSKNGWDVTVLTHFDERRKAESFGFKVLQVQSLPKIQPFFFYRKFLQVYRENHFEKIILNDAGASLMACLFFSKDLMAKSLVFLHGTEDEKLYHNGGMMFQILNTKAKYTQLLENCFQIIAVSHFLPNKFMLRTSLMHLASKISVIRNTVILPTQMNIVRPPEFAHSGQTVLFSAGRLVERKGFGKMLHLFHDIVQNDDNFIWYIAGEGPYRTQMVDLIDKLKLSAYVKLLGPISKDNMWSFYAFSDCFWLLTDFEEGLGLVFLESALLGCPVITYRKGGVVEVVNEKTGYLIVNDMEAKDIILNRRFLDLNRSDIKQEAEAINGDDRSGILQWL